MVCGELSEKNIGHRDRNHHEFVRTLELEIVMVIVFLVYHLIFHIKIIKGLNQGHKAI